MSFGTYQFLPWARRGIARHIKEPDTLGQGSGETTERASLDITVEVNGSNPITKPFQLLGPGDVTGIQDTMVVRTEPLNGIADFEPNLLPYIEFYDEDFPWRYTPAAPVGEGNLHLRPWLALVVLQEGEFGFTKRREPLPSIKIGDAGVLPPHDQLHLWAHMHSNLPFKQDQLSAFISKLEDDVQMDPDGVYSRLLCPRRLKPNALYHAFLIPSYEAGRLAGLGRSTTGVKAQQPAWPGAELEFPVYYQWSFRTGENFDFEYLVKLLEPRIMDERVGVRPMDCSRPAFVQADKPVEVDPPEPKIMLLEGALKAPSAPSTPFPEAGVPQPFFEQMEKLVNLNQVQAEQADSDPYVSVPYYGMNHAMQKDPVAPGKMQVPRFDPASTFWFQDLNRDPRHRVPAGFGVRVVQANQEQFMDQAWKQLEQVLEANKKMKLAQFAKTVTGRLYEKVIKPRSAEDLVSFTSALAGRVMAGNQTVKGTIRKSVLPGAVFDSSFRRITRNKTSFSKGLQLDAVVQPFSRLVSEMNKPAGLTAAAKPTFQAIDSLRNLSAFQPVAFDELKVWSRQSNLEEDFAYNITDFQGGLPEVGKWKAPFHSDIFRPPATPTGPGTIPGGGVFQPGSGRPAGPIVPLPNRPGPIIGNKPQLQPFAFRRGANPWGDLTRVSFEMNTGVKRPPILATADVAINKLDLATQQAAFTQAFTDLNDRFRYRDPKIQAPVLDLAAVKTELENTIRPAKAYKRLVDAYVKWPIGTRGKKEEEFLPAMAYPDIPEPSYKYLVSIDKEFLLPNLQLIPPNTLSLLRTNQKFIESYLMGLNHEMGRELLWREYPTDMRGSYFRQFWDVRGFVTPDTSPADAESLKDIKPIHTWQADTGLGRHNARDKQGDAEQLVFVIKGELLKKFPNTVIYAQKAITKEGKLRIEEEGLDGTAFRQHVRFPLYQAEIGPDIKLLGFDLTVEEASGKETVAPFTDHLGWYFIIAEVPGEPHFGMDVTFEPNEPGDTSMKWEDLSWKNFDDQLAFLRGEITPGRGFSRAAQPASGGTWGRSSADMATILLQKPVMVAIHANEMLDLPIPVPVTSQPFQTLLQHIQFHLR